MSLSIRRLKFVVGELREQLMLLMVSRVRENSHGDFGEAKSRIHH